MAIGGLVGLLLAAVVLLVSASGSPSSSSPVLVPTTRHVAEPAGPTPSASAQMVCAPESQKDITSFTGVPLTEPPVATWVDHVYSCRYAYASGGMVVSVKEVSN